MSIKCILKKNILEKLKIISTSEISSSFFFFESLEATEVATALAAAVALFPLSLCVEDVEAAAAADEEAAICLSNRAFLNIFFLFFFMISLLTGG